MKLKQYKMYKHSNVINPKLIITLSIVVFGLLNIIMYQSYALYKMSNTHNFVQGQVGEISNGDIVLAVYVDGEKTDTFPAKTSGKTFDKIVCTNDVTTEWDAINWKLILTTGEPTVCNVYFSVGTLLADQIKTDVTENGQMKTGNPNFAAASTNADTGMYTMTDDYGTSYYFRGTKTLLNNNVIFAGFQWKIIRINGDGTTRLIYNGICPDNNCPINDTGTTTSVSNVLFNNVTNNEKYVGYIYDNGTSSNIKTVNENWYKTNLSSYDDYIADAIFCGDRTSRSSDHVYYGAHDRLVAAKTPILTCPRDTDKYTKSAGPVSQKLEEKIGLITADEVSIAGTAFQSAANTTFYLFTNQNFWTITPQSYNKSFNHADCMVLNTVPWLVESSVTAANTYLRPVISLKSSVKTLGGNGSASEPYMISE